MKKVEGQAAADRIRETLISIANDYCDGKLKSGDDVHPFFRLSSKAAIDGKGLETQDTANLLTARLNAQGYTLLFDEALARETFNDALARLGGMLRSQ